MLTPPNRFALGTFDQPGGLPFPAMVVEDQSGVRIVPLAELALLGNECAALASYGSVLALLEDWEAALPLLCQARDELHDGMVRFNLEDVHVRPPVDRPRQIVCVGANYRTHFIEQIVHETSFMTEKLSDEERWAMASAEMDERAANGKPYAFSKLPSAVTGAYDPIILPADVKMPDWELELAVVIGRPARHVPRAAAFDYIAGYAIANDVTARDHFYRPDIPVLASDTLAGKSAPTFLPFGPWITPALFVADPSDLRIELKLNGETKQDGNTGDMVFGIAQQIEYISRRVQLLPGDVVCTGSPSGNGSTWKRYLQNGDVIEGSISGLGTMRNICQAEEMAA